MQTNQEYRYFLDRYKHIVYNITAKDLFSYVIYPLSRDRNPTRGPQDNYKNYDREDMARFKVDGKLVIPDGPFKIETYHIFRPNIQDPVIEVKKFGPSQLENFVTLIGGVTDTQFPKLIENYASRDCDFKYTKDCAQDLTRRLRDYWKLD